MYKHTIKTTSKASYDYPPLPPEKSITLAENPDRGVCYLYIRGAIEDVTEYGPELIELEKMSQKYDNIEVTINTPGGSLDTTTDIIQLLRKFISITTIGVSSVASAGTIIWGIGTVRVIAPYTTFMFHRETYSYYGKTSEHRSFAAISEKVNRKLFDETVSGFLTESELSVIENTELWLAGEEMIDRGFAISTEQFKNPVILHKDSYYVVPDHGSMEDFTFMVHPETGLMHQVNVEWTNRVILDIPRYAYGQEGFGYVDEFGTEELGLVDLRPITEGVDESLEDPDATAL